MLKIYTGSLSVTTDIINSFGSMIPRQLIVGSWENIQGKYAYTLILLLYSSQASAFGLYQAWDTAEHWFWSEVIWLLFWGETWKNQTRAALITTQKFLNTRSNPRIIFSFCLRHVHASLIWTLDKVPPLGDKKCCWLGVGVHWPWLEWVTSSPVELCLSGSWPLLRMARWRRCNLLFRMPGDVLY